MAITFTCACGQRLSARDDLQGKTTKCPKCGASLTIPAADPAAPEASQPAPSSVPAPRTTPPPVIAPPLDDIPVREAPPPQSACPGCGAGMPLGAIICIACGYNAKTGRRIETQAAAPSVRGHMSLILSG